MNKDLFKKKLQRFFGQVATDKEIDKLIELIRPIRELTEQDIVDRGFTPVKENQFEYQDESRSFRIDFISNLGIFDLNGERFWLRDYHSFDCIMNAKRLPIKTQRVDPRDVEKQDFIDLGFEDCGEEYEFHFYNWKGYKVGFNFETQTLTGVGVVQIENQLHLTRVLMQEIFWEHGK